MDELAPSLRSTSSSSSNSCRSDMAAGSDNGSEAVESKTVIGRCAAAALSTGVDCVLDEEVSASREAGRVKGFPQVGSVLVCLFACWPVCPWRGNRVYQYLILAEKSCLRLSQTRKMKVQAHLVNAVYF